MTPLRRLTPLAWLAFGLSTTSCATAPTSTVAPLRLTMPQTAVQACALYRLPEQATEADLEIGFATRGAQISDCDARRRLAVDTVAAEHALQDQFRAGQLRRGRPWWRLWARPHR